MRALGASRTSVATGGVLAGNWARDPLWKNARAVPSLDLRFADNKTLGDAVGGGSLVTFTRASSATYVGSDGLIKTATTNEARFDHNPTTGESLGLLVEEARTNSIRNNTMVGAVAGTPGTVPTNWSNIATSDGLSRQIVGVGTQNGITYIDIRYSGTTTATASIVTQPELSAVTVAATGQSWTASSWLALAGGSTSGLTVIQRVTGRSVVGGFLENTDTTVALSSTLARYAASITMANALTLRVSNDIGLAYSSGAAIDITLRIGLPQLEQGAFATSVIPTTTATATRAADVASVTGTNFSSWYNQTEGTVFFEGINPAISTTAFAVSDGSINNRLQMESGTNSRIARVVSGGTTQAANSIAYTYGTSQRFAISYATDSINFANAGTLGTEDTSATIPAVDQLRIGANPTGANPLNSTIKRLTYFPTRLSNTVLRQISQP